MVSDPLAISAAPFAAGASGKALPGKSGALEAIEGTVPPMSTAGERKTYHHNDLRRALIEQGFAIVEAQGQEALSIRNVAKSIGVAASALYHHFSDVQTLKIEIAAKGFEKLHAVAHFSPEIAPTNPEENLRNIAKTLFEFARDNKNIFRLMFSGMLFEHENSTILLNVQKLGYDQLYAGIKDAYPSADEPEIRARVIAFLATIYGFAYLADQNMLHPYMTTGLSSDFIDEVIIRSAVAAYDVPAGITPAARS